MAVPVRSEMLAQLREVGIRIGRCAGRARDRAAEQLDACLRHFPARDALLAPQRQKLDELSDRLPRALRTELSQARAKLGQAGGALRPNLLVAVHRRSRERLAALWRVAELAHPNKPLERGYARVEDRDGHVLVSAAAARAAARLRLVFADGAVDANVGPTGGSGVERPRRGAYSPPGDEHPKLL
jgi:exodeoxyribonuclease VII large subunit